MGVVSGGVGKPAAGFGVSEALSIAVNASETGVTWVSKGVGMLVEVPRAVDEGSIAARASVVGVVGGVAMFIAGPGVAEGKSS